MEWYEYGKGENPIPKLNDFGGSDWCVIRTKNKECEKIEYFVGYLNRYASVWPKEYYTWNISLQRPIEDLFGDPKWFDVLDEQLLEVTHWAPLESYEHKERTANRVLKENNKTIKNFHIFRKRL